MMQLEPLTVYGTTEYFNALLSRIAATKRGSRIALMSMLYDPAQTQVSRIVHELTVAAARGVQVYLIIDAHAFSLDQYELPTGPAMFKHEIQKSRRPHFRQKYLNLEKLKESGGNYAIINSPNRAFLNPFSGRSHIKLAVVDAIAFVGGRNLNNEEIDYMVELKHAATVDRLYKLAVDIAERKSVRQVLQNTDCTFEVDNKTDILIDAGEPGQSLIYQNALDFIDNAKEWLVMTCQFFPNNLTAEHLAAAVHRGVDVTLYYNHPRHHAPHMRPLQRAVIMAEKTHRPAVLFAHQLPKDLQRLHAKLLASEQGAMVGSHNYVTQGVDFGTAEIAIRRYDKSFAEDTLSVLKQYLPTGYTEMLP